MTSRCIRNGEGHQSPGGLKEIVISCDQMDCMVAVNDTQISDGGGLKKMGWDAVPINGALRHYCPEHSRNSNEQEKK